MLSLLPKPDASNNGLADLIRRVTDDLPGNIMAADLDMNLVYMN